MARLMHEDTAQWGRSRVRRPADGCLCSGRAPAVGFDALGPADHPELIEPLRERELDEIALVAEGLADREIVARLFVSSPR